MLKHWISLMAGSLSSLLRLAAEEEAAAWAEERAEVWAEWAAEERRVEWAVPNREARGWDPAPERQEAAAWEAALDHSEGEAVARVIPVQAREAERIQECSAATRGRIPAQLWAARERRAPEWDQGDQGRSRAGWQAPDQPVGNVHLRGAGRHGRLPF
jgi:hypothetical protein